MKKIIRLSICALLFILIDVEARALVLPTVLQFYGPSSWDGRLIQLVGPEWTIPTGAYTNTTKTLWVPPGELPHIRWARWVLAWTQNSCGAGVRLRARQFFTNQMTEIGSIIACNVNGSLSSATADRLNNPDMSEIDVTAQLNALITAVGPQTSTPPTTSMVDPRTTGYFLTYEIRDDGSTPIALWESRLEIWYDIPTGGGGNDGNLQAKIDALLAILHTLKDALP